MFAPFFVERGGSICQCSWNEGGTEIEQAVPELYKSIKGHPEWRAIIFIHPTQTDSESFNSKNPFDFNYNRENGILIQENPIPLVRLTHMLSGFPPLGVKDYKMGFTYYNVQKSKFLDCLNENGTHILQEDVNNLSEEKREILFAKYETLGGNIKPRLIEVPYSEDEKNNHRLLAKKYTLKENRPIEVLIVTTREICDEDDREATREEVRHVWASHDEEESSDFWKIYPNTCRFLCYDLINPEHTLYRRELWRLCLLVLSLAINQIPSQALNAYRLYNTDITIDAKELGWILDEHIENLISVQSMVEERINREPDLTQTKKEELVPIQNISVKFEQVTQDRVMVQPQKFGLASDCPIPEKKYWKEHTQDTKQIIDNILSAPQEIVVNKALETRRKIESYSGIGQVLDRFQIERIHKRINELEAQVINSCVYGRLDPDEHKEKFAKAEEDISKFLGLRLNKRNVLQISIFSLLVYLCGFIPYFVNSAKINIATFGAAFGFALIALVLLAGGGLLILFFLRRRLIRKFKKYNHSSMSTFDLVNKGAEIYTDYFSSVCTYMYARSLLSGVILRYDNDYTEVRILKAHLASLKREIDKSKQLCDSYEVSLDKSNAINTYIDIDENLLLEMPSDSQIYELVSNDKTGTMELGNTGENLNAPYSFIIGIRFTREELYTKIGETSQAEGA
jgi:hypothetical protein